MCYLLTFDPTNPLNCSGLSGGHQPEGTSYARIRGPGPAQEFFLLKGSFSVPLLLVGGWALGFSESSRDSFDCNKCYIKLN